MTAPEPYLSACVAVLHRAAIAARALGWSGERHGLGPEQSECIGDLMDAIHDLPHMIAAWEWCDAPALRDALEAFDARWADVTGLRLIAVFDGALLGHRSTRPSTSMRLLSGASGTR